MYYKDQDGYLWELRYRIKDTLYLIRRHGKMLCLLVCNVNSLQHHNLKKGAV